MPYRYTSVKAKCLKIWDSLEMTKSDLHVLYDDYKRNNIDVPKELDSAIDGLEAILKDLEALADIPTPAIVD